MTFRRVAVSLRGPGQLWAPLTHKRHPPQPAQPRYTNDGAPRTRKRHEQEHRPQRPTQRSDPTQHAKGCCGGRLAVFADHPPPLCGRPPHASPRFRVREARVPHSSAGRTGRPPPALHNSVGRACVMAAGGVRFTTRPPAPAPAPANPHPEIYANRIFRGFNCFVLTVITQICKYSEIIALVKKRFWEVHARS